jgi:hypothetical protein
LEKNDMALKRSIVPGVKQGHTRIMGGGTRSPVIGRIKKRDMGSGKSRRSR